MIKTVVALASAAGLALLSNVAAAQNPGANLGAQVTTDAGVACQGDATCIAELQRCLADLRTATETSKDALEKLNKCESVKAKPKPVPPPAAPVCSGPYMNKSDCTCRLEVDGSGDKNPRLARVRQFGTGAVICVSQDDLRPMVIEMRRQIEAIQGKVQGWDDAKRKVDLLLTLVSNGEPEVFATQWTELLSWYAGAKQAIADLRKDVGILIQNDTTTQQSLSALCPPLEDRPQATMVERCDAASRKGSGTKVEFEASAGIMGGHRPGSGGYWAPVARAGFAYHIPNSQWALVANGLVSYVQDQDTGRQIGLGGEGGVRYHFTKDKRSSLDLLAYGMQVYSTHGAGHQGMPDKGMGYDVGGRLRPRYCFTEGFCIGGDVGVGYTPRNNSFPSAYKMDAHSGATFSIGIGLSGRILLF